MTLKLITPPSAEAVSLADAKLHLRVDQSNEDALIQSLVTAAREQAEHITGRAFESQTWERVLDAFPASEIELGKPVIQSIESITYVDTDGNAQVLPPSAYFLDADTVPGFVLPALGYVWPSTLNTVNAVRVRFVSGTATPESVKTWIKLRLGTLYANREEGGLKFEPFADHLLDSHAVY